MNKTRAVKKLEDHGPDFIQSAEQHMYADQPLQLQIGAFTSTLALGGSNGRSVVAITMPTDQLLIMAQSVIDAFGQSDLREDIDDHFTTFSKAMQSVPTTS